MPGEIKAGQRDIGLDWTDVAGIGSQSGSRSCGSG